jgi:hypothetical protein
MVGEQQDRREIGREARGQGGESLDSACRCGDPDREEVRRLVVFRPDLGAV